jgi:dipeptidyl-peptidase-4
MVPRTHRCTWASLALALGLFILPVTELQAQVRGNAVKQILARAQQVQGTLNVTWTPDGSLLQIDKQGDGIAAYRIDPETGTRHPLLADSVSQALLAQYASLSGQPAPAAGTLPFRNFGFRNQGELLVFVDGANQTYVFDLKTLKLRKLIRPKLETPPDADALMRNLAGSQLVNGTFSPDYSHIAYVRGYDLYVTNTATGAETQLTTGGSPELMNGRPDWVYPEELNQTEAFFWSPDGKKIAYLQFDERPVAIYPIVNDLTPQATLEQQRYPKAGAPNPIVKLFIVDIQTKKVVEVATNSSGNVYIIRPNWTPDGAELLFQRLNRHQDTLELLAANPQTGAVRTVLVESDPAYVNLEGGSPGFGATPLPIQFLKDGKRFLWPSERSGWRNWYLYDLSGKQLAHVTNASYVFDQITAVDEAKGIMYVTAHTNEGQETHLFQASLSGGKVTQLTEAGAVHRINMDPTGRYYLDVKSTDTIPAVATLRTIEGKVIRQTGSVTLNLQGANILAPEHVVVKAADGVTNLHGVLFKPTGFDSTKKYPLVVQVYGGPQLQNAPRGNAMVSSYNFMAQDGYMVWVVDNRGTPNRGRDFERATHMKLGQVDLDDQAAAVRQLLKTHPYIDSTRIGIIGSSYGGYLSALALLRYPDLFHVGVAIAAVTDWRNYDSPYTERYMRLPQNNREGYDKGSTLTYAGNLRGKLMIMHGTTDNNVHVGNAMQLISALQRAGKSFEVMMYPGERHGVSSGQLSQQFLAKYLKPERMD